MNVIFNYVASILLHECFMNQASLCHFTTDLETTENVRDIKGLRVYHLLNISDLAG